MITPGLDADGLCSKIGFKTIGLIIESSIRHSVPSM